VVLLALSVGYFFGGKLADKYPKEKVFYSIIAASGACTIFLHILGVIFLSAFGYQLPMIEGPVIASLLLFFLQNFLLGLLSPFAVKLQAARQESVGIGAVSGQIFFWSTFGSIAGSLLAGFFLIPYFGVNVVIISVGFLLFGMGLLMLLKLSLMPKILLAAVLIVFSIAFTQTFLSAVHALSKTPLLYSAEGLYQKIMVYDGQYLGQPARFLMQDRNPSAGEFLHSDELAFGYTKYYILYKIFNPDAKEALMIGGGAYSVPKALLVDSKDIHIDVAEIEPSLFDVAKRYFNVPVTPRLTNAVEDGRRLLVDSPKPYDLIFSDAYASLYSTPSHLTTQEFFTLAKNKLTPDGVFIANVIGSLAPKQPSLLLSEIKTFKAVFPNSYFFAVISPESEALQNVIFVGNNSSKRIDFKALAQESNPIMKGLAAKQIDISAIDFLPYSLLTDDFSPVEYLTAKEL
jgi:spermidine synthase